MLVVGDVRGVAFSISPWERSAEALRFWTTGDWDSAIAVLQAQLVDDPENANVLYNLACAESRGGRLEPACLNISREQSSSSRGSGSLAHGDTDFDARVWRM